MEVRESVRIHGQLRDPRSPAGKASLYYKLPKVHPMRGRKIRHSTTFALGLLIGAFVALVFNIAGSLTVMQSTMVSSYVGIRLFRGFFIVFLHIILMGINVYGWRRAGVNHVLVFQVNPRDNLNYQSLMTVGMGLLVLWAVSAVGYIYAPLFGASQIQFPALMGTVVFIFTFIPMSQPSSIMIMSSRRWMIRHFFRCITAPFHRVRFADFWFADQMTSLAVVWLDFSYFVCFFTLDA
uniref:EXS domain-containing protein n=1 Tax=Plectus sambesii TaxID=2011161 RepID=A0A914UPH6_9BILA